MSGATVRAWAEAALYDQIAGIIARSPARRAVLDIPAGAGALAVRLAALGLEVVAADLHPLTSAIPGTAWVRADMEGRLPFADEAFDLVASLEGIEHLRSPFAFLGECARVLSPGGRLILSTPNIHKLTSRVKFLLGGLVNGLGRPLDEAQRMPPFGHINLLSYYQLRYMLRALGFCVCGLASSRRKATDRALGFLVPAIYGFTWLALARERDPRQRKANAEIFQHMLSGHVLYSKHLIVVAEREPPR
ncbi:MAG: class I SAM-dependent methyltransferase [candidate division NC10 bacterium]|nr:class I SAM-dependent methyltransferase [candidate division NC10 bacterium]